MIKVNSINLQGNEKKYINQCIDDNWISGSGKFNLLFEKKIQNLVKKKYAISTTNGTTALETAVQSLNLKKGDEVILPSFTIISCFNAIVKNGLIPVPVDCNFGDWNMDIEKLKKKNNK
jgi:perosamine synthetase